MHRFFQRGFDMGYICEGIWYVQLLQKHEILINKFLTPFLTLDKFLKCVVIMHNQWGIYSMLCYVREV